MTLILKHTVDCIKFMKLFINSLLTCFKILLKEFKIVPRPPPTSLFYISLYLFFYLGHMKYIIFFDGIINITH